MTLPVVLFVYNRPGHTQKTLEALAQNYRAKDVLLTVFADGPRTFQDANKIKEIYEIVESYKERFKEVRLFRSLKNLGLAKSIIQGVSKVAQEMGRVIVLEDDLVTSPNFLDYMAQGLERYQDDPKVGSIHGYMYPTSADLPETFFLRGGDCWGWATWQSAWDYFEPSSEILIRQLKEKKLIGTFNLDGAYPYFQMLKNEKAGKISSWAIRWHASLFLKNMLTLYPKDTLVQNIGMDGSGTHQDSGTQFDQEWRQKTWPQQFEFPQKCEENTQARLAIAEFWMRSRRGLSKWIWQYKIRKLREK